MSRPRTILTQEQQDFIVQSAIKGMKIYEVADQLNLSRSIVTTWASSLDVLHLFHKGVWTEEMKKRLREIYPTATPEELQNEFPGISITCIETKAMKLGVRKTKEYNKKQRTEVAKKMTLGRLNVTTEPFNSRVKVKIVLDSGAVIPFKKQGNNDFAYDCVATSCEQIAPDTYRYGLGIHLQKDLIYDHTRIAFRIAPKSGIWKTGLVLSNSEGIVDEQYNGEISAIFYHVMKDRPIYKVGDKVCQLYMQYANELEFITVDKLNETQRGAGREGSTGL